MSSVSYANILIDRAQVKVAKRSMMAGNQYLYTRVLLDIQGQFNPELNAYAPTSGAIVNTYRAPGGRGGGGYVAIAPGQQNPFTGAGSNVVVAGAGGTALAAAPPPPPQTPQTPRTTVTVQTLQIAKGAVSAPGALAPVTEAAVRHFLMQPRQKLVLEVANLGLLVSPAFSVCDCNNGPNPIDADVIAVTGDKTFIVHLLIETFINETPFGAVSVSVTTNRPGTPSQQPAVGTGGYANVLQSGAQTTSPFYAGGYAAASLTRGAARALQAVSQIGAAASGPLAAASSVAGGYSANPRPASASTVSYAGIAGSPLLAHEWSMQHVLDQDFFCTRYVKGRAVFRRDVLEALQAYPDQFRQWFCHPIPPGMNRQGVNVTALPDGVTIEYQIADRERALPINNPNEVTRIEAMLVVDEDMLGVLDATSARGSIGAGLNIGGSIGDINIFGDTIQNHLVRGARTIGGIVGFGRGNFTPNARGGDAADSGHRGATPMRTYIVKIRVWGHLKNNATALLAEAQKLVASRTQMLALNFQQVLNGWKRSTLQDMSGRFVETNYVIKGTYASTFLAGALSPQDNAFWIGSGNNDATGPVPQILYPPNPVRGSYLGACVARALRNSGDPWPLQQDPPQVTRGGFSDTNIAPARTELVP